MLLLQPFMDAVKENIIQVAGEQFNRMGIRNVSIDDVCAELRMSKKTFYQHFSKKEDLIDSVILYERDIQQAKMEKGMKDKNAIEVFVYMVKEIKKNSECAPFMFWHDLEKYYPALYQKHDQIKRKNIRHSFEANIHQGVAEGYYRENLDIELLSYFHSAQIKSTFETIVEDSNNKFTMKRINDFFIDMIIHLIANDKGLKYIEEHLRG